MLENVAGLVQADIENQKAWAAGRVRWTARSTSLMAAAGIAAGLFALALVVIGLMALYRWAELRYGPLPAFGIVGGLLAGVSLIFFGLAFLRPEVSPQPRPDIATRDPARLQGAADADWTQHGAAALEALRRSPLGPAIAAGEGAHATGRKLTQLAADKLGIEPRPIYPVLIAAGIIGSVLLRRR